MKTMTVGVFLLASAVCFGQRAPLPPADDFTSNKPSVAPTSVGDTDYRIGSNDQLDIDFFEIADLAASPRVSASGTISLKFIGNLQAGGLTTQQLERAIEKSLKDMKWVNDPHVTVSVREYASQPVSVMGAVRMPNIYQIKGQKSLFSMISMAQGLDANTVGSTIQVIRAAKDSVSEREVLTIAVEDFRRGDVAVDFPIYANDTINVQSAGSVFVIGEVIHPDEFVLRNGVNLSVLQALSKGGGPTKEAKKKESVIIRVRADGSREEISVDLDKILKGKADDVQMVANDILFVPASRTRVAFNRTLESTIGIVTGRLIYR